AIRDGSLLRHPRDAGPQEEAVDLGAARLAEAAARRGHPARGAAQRGPPAGHPAALRGAAQERAGRAPLRAAAVPAETWAITSFLRRQESSGRRGAKECFSIFSLPCEKPASPRASRSSSRSSRR